MTSIFDETMQDRDVSDRPSGWENNGTPDPGFTCTRHRWEGGDVCVRCGAQKDAVRASKATESGSVEVVGKSPRTPRGSRTGDLETLISIGWGGIGFGIGKQPWLLQEPTGRTDSEGNEITVAKAVSATWLMESAVAGKRIDRALRRTPVYRHIQQFLTPAGVVADLAPLFVPPLLVGLAAYKPEVAQGFKPLMMAMMIPVLTEAAKMQEQQAELMGRMGDVNAETIQQASDFIDSIIGVEES